MLVQLESKLNFQEISKLISPITYQVKNIEFSHTVHFLFRIHGWQCNEEVLCLVNVNITWLVQPQSAINTTNANSVSKIVLMFTMLRLDRLCFN